MVRPRDPENLDNTISIYSEVDDGKRNSYFFQSGPNLLEIQVHGTEAIVEGACIDNSPEGQEIATLLLQVAMGFAADVKCRRITGKLSPLQRSINERKLYLDAGFNIDNNGRTTKTLYRELCSY